MSIKTIAAGAVAVAALTGAAQAACSTKQLVGLWVFQPQVGDSGDTDTCALQFSKTGKVVKSACFDSGFQLPIGTITGTASINGRCEFVATFTWRSKGKRTRVEYYGDRQRDGAITGQNGGTGLRLPFVMRQVW